MKPALGPAEEIFLALATVPAGEREAVLRERCGSDAALRADVESMLAALDAPDDGFLDPAEIPAIDMAAVDGPLRPGTTLGDVLVLHAIGSGAMGVVYAAQQDRPRRTVALKVLRRGFRHPEIRKRFEREAEVLGRLQHPGIAQVFRFHAGDRDTPAHLVMELVEGLPLTEYAQAYGLSVAARVDLIVMLCDAVQHAHDKRVVHRDLKPANVLVSEGRPKILDFGIARATGVDLQSGPQTSHGQLLGTLAYMSPEQLRGASREVDARSDVYAIGVLLFRLLAGRLPYEIDDLPLLEAAQHILQHDPPRLRTIDPDLDESLEMIAARAMARRRRDRYLSAAALARDLRIYREGGRPDALTGDRRAGAGARVRVAVSADDRQLAIALTSGVILVLDARSGDTIGRFAATRLPIVSCAFGRNGDVIAVSDDGTTESFCISPPA